uniref:Uncharacterized protein n=1 Tax=Arundo donax TaxID=35708 RepID=A0A0A9BIV3_ARUDO
MCLLTNLASAPHYPCMFSWKLTEQSWPSGHTFCLKSPPQ